MTELVSMLHKEEAGLTVDRSLEGAPADVQSFQIFMSGAQCALILCVRCVALLFSELLFLCDTCPLSFTAVSCLLSLLRVYPLQCVPMVLTLLMSFYLGEWREAFDKIRDNLVGAESVSEVMNDNRCVP
jgi:hypothetical protein